MNSRIALIIAGVLCLVIVPLVPPMMRLRIGILRRLHLNWLADLHENHFDGFVLAVRIILIVGGLALLARSVFGA